MSKKTLGIISLVVSILSIVALFIPANSYDAALIIYAIGAVLGIAGVILGFISVKEGKAMSVIGIIIGVIIAIVLLLAVMGCVVMKNSKDCIATGDDVYTCSYNGTEVEVPASLVTEDQKKKD